MAKRVSDGLIVVGRKRQHQCRIMLSEAALTVGGGQSEESYFNVTPAPQALLSIENDPDKQRIQSLSVVDLKGKTLNVSNRITQVAWNLVLDLFGFWCFLNYGSSRHLRRYGGGLLE